MANRVGNVIYNNFDRFTGEAFTTTDVTTWYDRTAMDDTKVDNVIYFKNTVALGGGYGKRNYSGKANIMWFGAKPKVDCTTVLNQAVQLPYPLQIDIPEGDWLIRNSITPTSNKAISGRGFGTRIYSDLVNGNPNYGFNFFQVVNQQNVSLSNMYLNGTYNAGTSFPPAGDITGQGVTACFAGCRNVKVTECFLDKNGRGSGSIYFSKCINFIATNNIIEVSTNGICVDNYYGPNNTFGGSYAFDGVISNNIIRDVGGRGITIDCMESAAINCDFVVSGNVVNAAAFAGIQINARGAIVSDNNIDCKRDDGHSTVGGQQSFPTLYGLWVDIGCENIEFRGNKVDGAMHHGIKTQYAKNVVFENNKITLAVSYKDQTIGFQTVFINDSSDIPIFFNWVDNLRGNPENIIVKGNTVINQRDGGVSLQFSPVVVFNDTSNNTTMGDNTNFVVSNNIFDCLSMGTGISYFRSAGGKRGDGLFESNQFNCVSNTTAKFGISAGSLNHYTIKNNEFNNVDTPIVSGRAGRFVSQGNVIQGYTTGYLFNLANVNAEIDYMVCADSIIGPTTGFIFSSPSPNPYVVTHSNGQGMRFVGIGNTTTIRNSYFPAYIIVHEGYTAAPTTGRWTSGDIIVNNSFPVTDNTFVKEWYRRTTSTNNTVNSNNSTTNSNFTTDWIPSSSTVNGMLARKYQTTNLDMLPYATGFNNQGSTFETLAGTPNLPNSETFLAGINFFLNSDTGFWSQFAKGTGYNIYYRTYDPVNSVWGAWQRIFTQYLPVRILTTTGSLSSSDYTALCDATSAVGSFNVVLPTTTLSGLTFVIKKTDASINAVTVKGTIDGVTDFVLPSQNDVITVQSTGGGTDYKIINKSIASVSNDIKLLATVNAVNAKATGASNLYTAPFDTIITKIVTKVISATAITQGPSIDFGVTAGDVIVDTLMTGLTTTTVTYTIDVTGISNYVPSGSILKATINTAAVGTSMVISYDVFGYKKV